MHVFLSLLLLSKLAWCTEDDVASESTEDNTITIEHDMDLSNLPKYMMEYFKTQSLDKGITTMLPSVDNPSFQRTKSVQYFLDYIEIRWNQKYPEYSDEHLYVDCLLTYSMAGEDPEEHLQAYSESVADYIGKYGMYNQDYIKTITYKGNITDETNGGLSAINNQFGLFAKQKLTKHQCIGHYYGDEYLGEEFDAMVFELDEPLNGKKKDYSMYMNYEWAYEFIELEHHVMIDAYHPDKPEKEIYEIYVNDCREDLTKGDMTEQDLKRKNSEFAYCSINGVLQPFLVATRDIEEGEQLFVYYGPDYGVLEEGEHAEWEKKEL